MCVAWAFLGLQPLHYAFAQSEPSLAPFSGYTYCFLTQNLQSGEITAVQPTVAQTAFSPASTWKWVNALIALETGIAPDTTFALPWDGTQYSLEAWNRNHTLASAFRASCVWYNQALARKIGPALMQRWVDTLAYGNQAIGNAVDQFWLNGTMRISPRQQLELLAKLHLSELPIAPNTRARLLGMFHQASVEGKAIGYKTGLGLTDSGVFTGWYVGHVQGPTGTQVFVALIHGTSPVSASQPDTLQAAIQLRHQFTSAMLRRYLSVDLP